MRRPLVISNLSLLDFLIYEENFAFFFISVLRSKPSTSSTVWVHYLGIVSCIPLLPLGNYIKTVHMGKTSRFKSWFATQFLCMYINRLKIFLYFFWKNTQYHYWDKMQTFGSDLASIWKKNLSLINKQYITVLNVVPIFISTITRKRRFFMGKVLNRKSK
jgi:hypothetical protein